MDQPPPVIEAPPPAAPQAPSMSLLARLLNVFAVPGDVFDDTRVARPCAANWLVPVCIATLVGVLSAIIMFSQPAIQQQLREQQEQAMEKKFDELIKAGRLTREQADQQKAFFEKFFGPTMMKVVGAAGAVAVSFGRVFWWATVLWLLGFLVLKTRFGYMKTVEIVGLASMIAVLGAVMTLLLTVNLGKLIATPSLALTVSDFNMSNKSHLLLAAVNVFSFWQVAVLAIGLARLAATPFVRAALVVFAFWVVWELALIAIGLGQFAI